MSSIENIETFTSPARGYVQGNIRLIEERYTEEFEPGIDEDIRDKLSPVSLYKKCLSDNGHEERLIDAISLDPFLGYIDEGINSCQEKLVHVPSLDDRYKKVNDRLRFHLGRLIAEKNGLDPNSYIIAPIDWDNVEPYRDYASGSVNKEFIARVESNPDESGCSVAVYCQYMFDVMAKNIIGIDYSFAKFKD